MISLRFLSICIVVLLYTSSALAQSAFERHDIHSAALLPIIGDAVPETVRDLLAAQLAAQLGDQFSKVKLKNVADSLSGLRQAGELNDLGNLANLYTKVGIIDSEVAGRIAKTLDVDSILLINVQEYLAQKGKWSRGKSSYNSLRAQCYLLNSLGQPIWHHLVAYVHDPHPWLSAKPDSPPEVMEKVAGRVTYALSRNIENSDPKKDIKP